ncbi:hypothetical protein ZWY2020_040885 [Hordeum vulgare]|nr:hypothetical protein ZWY2020_040885 [Hordeum vulgare]
MKLPVLVDVAGKPTMPKPAAARAAARFQPNHGKRKVDQPDTRQGSQKVATVKDDHLADGQGSSRRQRTNDGKQPWQAKYTFEAMLDGPCKFHSGAKPATHTARQCFCSPRSRAARPCRLRRLHHLRRLPLWEPAGPVKTSPGRMPSTSSSIASLTTSTTNVGAR